MTKVSSFLLGGTVALALIGAAHADPVAPTGAWKLSTGVNDAPCVVTLTSDAENAGTIASTGDCNGTDVGHWTTVGSSLRLSSPSGELVAMLKPKGDTYEGKRISDGRLVALAR